MNTLKRIGLGVSLVAAVLTFSVAAFLGWAMVVNNHAVAQDTTPTYRLPGLYSAAFVGAGIRADAIVWDNPDTSGNDWRIPPGALAAGPTADRWLKATSADAMEWTDDVATKGQLEVHGGAVIAPLPQSSHLPTGGAAGDVLIKRGSPSYDVEWTAQTEIDTLRDPYNATPERVGATGAAGTHDAYSRGDHRHAGLQLDTSSIASTLDVGPLSGKDNGDNPEAARHDHVHGLGINTAELGWTTDDRLELADSVTNRFPCIPPSGGAIGYVLSKRSASNCDIQWRDDRVPSPATATPEAVASTGTVGTSTQYARADHRHRGATTSGGTDSNPGVPDAPGNLGTSHRYDLFVPADSGGASWEPTIAPLLLTDASSPSTQDVQPIAAKDTGDNGRAARHDHVHGLAITTGELEWSGTDELGIPTNRLLPSDATDGQIAVWDADAVTGGAWVARAHTTGGGGDLTAEDILDLAQSTRTSADRGRALVVKDDDEDALELRTLLDVTAHDLAVDAVNRADDAYALAEQGANSPARVSELNNGRWPDHSFVYLTQAHTHPDEDEHVFEFAPRESGNYLGYSRATYGGNPPALGTASDIPSASGILAVYLLYEPATPSIRASSKLYVLMQSSAPTPTAIHLTDNPFADATYPLVQTATPPGQRLLRADDIAGSDERNMEDTNYGRAAFRSLESNGDTLKFGLHVGALYLDADGTTSAGTTVQPGYYQRIDTGNGWQQVYLATEQGGGLSAADQAKLNSYPDRPVPGPASNLTDKVLAYPYIWRTPSASEYANDQPLDPLGSLVLDPNPALNLVGMVLDTQDATDAAYVASFKGGDTLQIRNAVNDALLWDAEISLVSHRGGARYQILVVQEPLPNIAANTNIRIRVLGEWRRIIDQTRNEAREQGRAVLHKATIGNSNCTTGTFCTLTITPRRDDSWFEVKAFGHVNILETGTATWRLSRPATSGDSSSASVQHNYQNPGNHDQRRFQVAGLLLMADRPETSNAVTYTFQVTAPSNATISGLQFYAIEH